jgi:hypothetical protein
MGQQLVLAGSGEQLAQQVAEWIQEQTASGARLFALEALMGAGKTTTTDQIRGLLPTLVTLGLDTFLDKSVPLGSPWSEMYDMDEAVRQAQVHLKSDDAPLLIEGAICWPTAKACSAETRYLYMKRMRPLDFWLDESDLTGNLKHPTLRRMVRDHQAATEPWRHADLIMERLAGPDEPS